MEYDNYTFNETSKDLPLKIWEAAPVYGKKFTTFSIEVHSQTELSIVMTHVYAFRDGFEKHGIKGGRFGASEKTKGEYVRLLPKIDVTKDESRVIKVIEDVLHNVVMRILVEGDYEDNSPVGQFMAKLRERPNMYFF